MSKKQENLTHEEMWDDSALIDSWNEALAEYKKYHSIHAKGGSVRDLEAKNHTVDMEPESDQPQQTEAVEAGLESTSARETMEEDKAVSSSRNESKEPAAPQDVPSFPVQTVLGSVRDESLKKLLMSWYYAGYYTGLYEGQQQAQQNPES
ncbi:hypothetical protein F66182_2930 [Fusarium sp. NRRL 66182]|nr:hypothetical protein F66182_2930 [Fusarium sp. NRRL 66182]